MSASAKITLSGLPRAELEALAERLLAENAALRRAVAELRAEVAAIKGVKGRPELKPSGMEKATEPGPPGKGRGGAKARKAGRLTVDEERVVEAEVPAGSRFKGLTIHQFCQTLQRGGSGTRNCRRRWMRRRPRLKREVRPRATFRARCAGAFFGSSRAGC